MKLVKVSSNQVVAKYHVENKDGDICGSINVSPNEEADLLRSWAGEGFKMQIQMSATKPNPFVAALMKAAKAKGMSQAAILRSC